MKKLILLLALSCFQFFTHAQDNLVVVKNPNGDDYIQGRINLKVKPEFRAYFSELKNTIPGFESLEITGLRRKFPQRKPLAKQYNDSGRKLPDLSLIYELDYNAEQDVFKTSEQLMSSGYFDYAEPHYVSYPLAYDPTDPRLDTDSPYHFNTMQLYDAWDVTLGDTNVIIGYTETSFDLGHEDLSGNVKHNYADPIGGGDDGDGYTDNFSGWDMVDNDNDVYIPNEIHGTGVAAVGSATGDNDKGYLGSGFKCMFLPVKVANSSQVITQGYEGIVYCVDHGAKIVNCSWGNTTFNQLAQDVVDDATLVNDVLIIASAGNANSENYYYPASYEYVLSVTGVDANNLVDPPGGTTPFTRNDSVDVSAPGFNVFSTARVGGTYYYQTTGGTSIASPLVAGVAGLVWSQFPCLTALEVGEQIKATADNIDAVIGNEIYAGKIGTGRVNAYQAVLGNLCEVSVGDEIVQDKIVIYPNPTSNSINFMLKSITNSKAQISIVNAVSEEVISNRNFNLVKGNNFHTIDVSELAAGIYYCTVKTDESSFSKKIVVVR